MSKLNVCEEVPVRLVFNGKKLATFMCTPLNLNELAVGYVYNRGLIKNIEEIMTLAICNDLKIINLNTENEVSAEQYTLVDVIKTGCGNESNFSREFLQENKITTELRVSVQKIRELTHEMFKKMVIYHQTGGVHCSALADKEKLLVVREDIGRHNAIDKIVGNLLFKNEMLEDKLIITTGRISSDMLLKAVAAKIPFVVSRSIPSSLALEMAEIAGVTIVGRVLSSEPIIYTHARRVVDNRQVVLYNKYA